MATSAQAKKTCTSKWKKIRARQKGQATEARSAIKKKLSKL